MRPSSGNLPSCACCKDASNMEFGKILDMKDLGVAIYRYLPQAQNENQKGTDNGEVFILQNMSSGDVKLEKLITESGKKKISCPRCMKTIERVKSLLKGLPPRYIREVTSICDHCYQKEFLNCPCCENIVDKFIRFRMEETKQTDEERERNKSWIIKTQLALKKSLSNVKESKLESRTDERIQESHPKQVPKPAFISETSQKQRVKGGSQLQQEEKKYQLAEQAIEKELRLHKPIKESVSDTKVSQLEPRIKSDGRIEEPQPRFTKKPIQEPVPFLEMYEKQRLKGKSEFINDQRKDHIAEEILEKPLRVLSFLDFPEEYIKPVAKKEKTGILKSTTAPGDISVKTKRSVFPKKQHSFETVMKSLSEPNVSDFSYSFPHEKIVLKKQMRRQISSSELIKNTQEMLQEREEAEKKKKAEITRLKEEKKRLAEEEKRKREEENATKDKAAELEEGGEKAAKRKKRDDMGAETALIEQLDKQAKELSKEEKMRKQNEEDMSVVEKKARDAEKTIEDNEKQLTAESKRKPVMPDSEDRQKIGAKDRGDENLNEKDRGREEKQRDLDAKSALQGQVAKQAKEKSEEEKRRKQQEQAIALGEKKATDAEKAIVSKQKELTTEKKRGQSIPDIVDAKDQDDKNEKLDKKDKGLEEKQQDLAAKSVLKDQVAKQAKEKSEEEKKKKQQEQDMAIGEKKAKDAEKAIEDKKKQLATKKKSLSPEIKPDGKGDTGKGEKLEKPAKEQKTKDDTQGQMAEILKAQIAKQKQQEMEKEKLRKEQQKERELAEKKLKDLQTKKEQMAPVVKPLILTPEIVSDDEDVSVLILKHEEVTDIIKGQKIHKVRITKRDEDRHAEEPNQDTEKRTDKEEPELVSKQYSEQTTKQIKQDVKRKPASTSAKKSNPPDPEATKGVIRYTLSDPTFIDKGWTMLPTEKVVRKMNVYRMRPAKPEFDWFEHNKYKREMTYDSGEKLAEFDDNGRGRWYYRSGELALDYYDAEETNAGQRFVVYSTRQPDERGRARPRTILATFDYSGNGIVFDHTGKIRLKYNQTEGVVLDRTIGPVSHWKWHTLNDPPVLQQVMIDTQMPYKDPTILKMGDKNADQKRPDNEEMIAIEFENFLKEKRQKLTQSFKPFQIKMKAMKINENFSLRVLDQASVYLLFRDGTTNLKINLGMILDHKEIVDTDTAEIGEVSNTLDKLPACTDSIAGLQKAVAQAQAAERTRVRHERRLKQPMDTASVDALRAGCSRPPRTPILQASLTSCEKMTPKRFKPSCCNLYYSTELC